MKLLYDGDNLDVLRHHIPDETVDLVYLDPPFNSGKSYRLNEDDGAHEAFGDSWGPSGLERASSAPLPVFVADESLRSYLQMMAPRLAELHRVLKPSGTLFLHCDPRASHYLKVLTDSIFSPSNFLNEIIWAYGGRGAKAVSAQFPRNHDVILVYARIRGRHRHHRQLLERKYSLDEARRIGLRRDEHGRWFKTAPRGDYSDESIARLQSEGRIHRTRGGRVRIMYFLEERDGLVIDKALVGDTWSDIPDAMHMGNESTGYPTQKPEALLERIILSASDEGDLILDPFCGSGSAMAVAERLNRRWIGIDRSTVAIRIASRRTGIVATRIDSPLPRRKLVGNS